MAAAQESEQPKFRIGRYAAASSALPAALLLVHVALGASAAPYLYVTDSRANCGARMLANFAAYSVLWNVGALLAIGFVQLGYGVMRYLLWRASADADARLLAFLLTIALLGIPNLIGLASAYAAVNALQHPPSLPADVTDTRACKDLLILRFDKRPRQS